MVEFDFCQRCECCSVTWEDCHDCDEDGLSLTSDCIDDLCHGQERCIHGDLNPVCRQCGGNTGWAICLGGCDEAGKHDKEQTVERKILDRG